MIHFYCLKIRSDIKIKSAKDLDAGTLGMSHDGIIMQSLMIGGGLQEALELAVELFERIEAVCTDAYGYLEVYTELYRVLGLERAANALKRILEEFRQRVYNERSGHLEVFFDAQMNNYLGFILLRT